MGGGKDRIDDGPNMNAETSFRPPGVKKLRWVAWDEASNRFELEGIFTAGDLRTLAEWLDNPEHPVSMNLKLSKIE